MAAVILAVAGIFYFQGNSEVLAKLPRMPTVAILAVIVVIFGGISVLLLGLSGAKIVDSLTTVSLIGYILYGLIANLAEPIIPSKPAETSDGFQTGVNWLNSSFEWTRQTAADFLGVASDAPPARWLGAFISFVPVGALLFLLTARKRS